jgi:heme-degrading monooxygenase HmoA
MSEEITNLYCRVLNSQTEWVWKSSADLVNQAAARRERAQSIVQSLRKANSGPRMPFVSITRLRVRSWHFLPAFFVQAWRSARQAKGTEGNLAVTLARDVKRTFWTRTVWTSEQAMKSYMLSGIHRHVMPHLMDWCDEASVVHWTQEAKQPPTWEEAHQRLQEQGRPSKVSHPTQAHSSHQIAAPQIRTRAQLRFK